jgi:glycosyltransferase involved in cell wall biosynthesis
MKKVVIRVPCYNHEKYVGLCLESIAAQDYPHLEVIVFDDASKDGTAEIAERICRRYGFRFHRNERNIGVSATLNRMMEVAGPHAYVFSILASDDIMAPGAISSMVASLERNPEYIGTYGDVMMINAAGAEIGLMRNDRASGDLFEKVLFSEVSIPRTWILWTAEAYRKFGLYDEQMPLEDSFIFAKISRLGKICYSGSLVLYYRKHPGNSSADSWKMYEASNRLLESLRGEYFYPRLRELYGAENFFLLSRSHKREALKYFLQALGRPFRKQFVAGIFNIIGLGFIVDRFTRK